LTLAFVFAWCSSSLTTLVFATIHQKDNETKKDVEKDKAASSAGAVPVNTCLALVNVLATWSNFAGFEAQRYQSNKSGCTLETTLVIAGMAALFGARSLCRLCSEEAQNKPIKRNV
jgi:hypothetical protein